MFVVVGVVGVVVVVAIDHSIFDGDDDVCFWEEFLGFFCSVVGSKKSFFNPTRL